MKEPVIIQGGMGIGVSNWRLARAVSLTGQLGVVSGTILETILARRLQQGDPEGDMRRALEHFPNPQIAERVLKRYFVPGGIPVGATYKNPPMYSFNPSQDLIELTVAANFAEVYLAKEGHPGPVGINYLEKIQLPTLPSLYGALLAGVDYVLMGAGIPKAIPALLDHLALHEEVTLKLNVKGTSSEDDYQSRFDPRVILRPSPAPLKRPKFLAIVSSEVLGINLAKKSSSHVDGFIIEAPTAGGHNAPPRGPLQLTDKGEPIYGPKDEVDLTTFRGLGLPFWLAGRYGDPDKLKEALAQGAAGVQVGTLFAYCDESGFTDSIKRQAFEKAMRGEVEVFTDPLASPTNFPFKVVQLDGTLSDPKEYEARPRMCDLGLLRTLYKREDGTIGYRCPGEPVDAYLQKDGKLEETLGRKCICNGLVAAVGLEQHQRSGYTEKPLVTSGDDIPRIASLLRGGEVSYTAAEVVDYLLGSGVKV